MRRADRDGGAPLPPGGLRQRRDAAEIADAAMSRGERSE